MIRMVTMVLECIGVVEVISLEDVPDLQDQAVLSLSENGKREAALAVSHILYPSTQPASSAREGKSNGDGIWKAIWYMLSSIIDLLELLINM